MPLPIVIGAGMGIMGLYGLGKGIYAGMKVSEAKGIDKGAQSLVTKGEELLKNSKDSTQKSLEILGKTKLQILSGSIKAFVEDFSRIKDIDLKETDGISELKGLSASKEQFGEMREISLEATEMLKSGASSVASGALVAYGAYSGVMALGSASTGTGIATLSGVAAQNATLAWLGGGTLATGGYGMAGGMIVLGGLVAGPALAIGGVLFDSKAKQKLNDAKNNLDQAKVFHSQAITADIAFSSISTRANQIRNLLMNLDPLLKKGVKNMKSIIDKNGVSWKNYSADEKHSIYTTVQVAQTIKLLIDTPLMEKDGIVTQESEKVLIKCKDHLINLAAVV